MAMCFRCGNDTLHMSLNVRGYRMKVFTCSECHNRVFVWENSRKSSKLCSVKFLRNFRNYILAYNERGTMVKPPDA